jgi:hypothetical protein
VIVPVPVPSTRVDLTYWHRRDFASLRD